LIPVEDHFLHFSFSVDYNRAVNWSSNTLENKPYNIAKFWIITFGRDRTNKGLWNFYLHLHLYYYYYLPLSSKFGFRIHPYLVGCIIRQDAQNQTKISSKKVIFFNIILYQQKHTSPQRLQMINRLLKLFLENNFCCQESLSVLLCF
jgi:hypothetical protein